ncbi:flagellar hook-associated protein FlgK [Rosenbergiella australiborealis]|uniref:Flagellar hook-associated protein 1 n=1 Tax=Rosenbergiella australiborealis TaxID=1544696 RepID=A0ABS5T5F0_9GAMM|nr:flagellar hook-associated protein FlgK [Rosenbergiella australiborealis]MBT0727574.1 flagellar hook-associated protein FlgK [Rosenbergiella australiborealis]
MMNLFTIAAQGAQAAQNQLSVSASNIANQQTAGYSRQQISQSASVVSSVGNGVKTSDPSRITDQTMNQALWRTESSVGYYQSLNSWGTSLEKVIASSSTQPSTLLTGFFNALSALTSQPDATAYRQQLISSATTLASGLTQTSQTLVDQGASITEQQTATTEQVNQLSSQIADLNQQIERLGAGAQSNSLQDQRDQQVKTLSGLVNLSVEKTEAGSYTLSVQGATLVKGKQAAVVTSVNDPQAGWQLNVTMDQTSTTVADNVGGQLGGLYDYQQQVLSPLQKQVTGLMQSLNDQVNSTLAKGYDSQGNSGAPLFRLSAANGGGSVLSTTSLTPSELGLSLEKSATANGDNLTALLALQSATSSDNAVSLKDQASAITSQLATTNSQNSNQLSVVTAVNQQWQQQRDNFSAVNKDEEAVNLQTYLQAYQANMKVMSVGNQLFTELLNIFS